MTLISHLLFADDILIFCEASVPQIICIMDCLQIFCDATRQKVSNEKTRIFFSKRTLGIVREDTIWIYILACLLSMAGKLKKTSLEYWIRSDQRFLVGKLIVCPWLVDSH